ncbi:unnamed protein product [Clavelina lepadiformis]|uniref:Uncharacterized protein n=1 Tax=Clavelina lepadiformis TaxID=159417 RepID=A0ABP0H451_CLALP
MLIAVSRLQKLSKLVFLALTANCHSKQPFTRSRSNNFELRNKRPVIAQFGLTREIGYKIVSQTPDTDMIQIDEPGRVHINNDILINTQMSNFICDRYGLSAKEMNTKKSSNEKDKENNNEFGDDGYGIIQPKPSSIHDLVQDLSQCLSKCEIAEEKRESLFNDSDYDEVLDFMTSPNPKSSEEVKSQLNDESPADTTEPDLIDSSKRLSSTSASSSMTSSASSTALSTSGVESGEDRPVSKYAELDIAKILHTRKRIHRILQTPPQTSEENEEQDESPPTYTINKKKSSYLTKRYTHYGTVGRHSKGNIAVNRRCSSSSRPASTGDNDCNEYSHWQARDYSTFDPLRSRTDDNSSTPDSCFTSDARNERPRSRDSDPDDSGETNSTCNASENKRWSRLSSNSQNSDKALLTPSKGPWKAFRKFVNNSGSARAQAHEEMKATIYIRHNSSSNNNNKENVAYNNINNNNSAIGNLSPAKTDSKSDEEKGNNVSHNCISSGSVGVSSNYSPASISSSRSSTPSHYSSNSLMRRFSRKSRGRSPRRSSLPSQSAWDVRSGSCKDAGGSPGRKASPAGRFQYGDGSQRTDIESKVMESVENNVRERSKSELNKSSSKSSFRKRFFSFKRKRTQSQGRKSPVSLNEQVDGSENGKMNKSLSYSSPQLSVFAVNSNSKRPGLAQKLVF